jgi:hypothetical protein
MSAPRLLHGCHLAFIVNETLQRTRMTIGVSR